MSYGQVFISDKEAWHERMAIMQEEAEADQRLRREHADMNLISMSAGNSAGRTVYAMAATAAVRGDWGPAKEFCRREREKLGEKIAVELMRQIQKDVKDALAQRG